MTATTSQFNIFKHFRDERIKKAAQSLKTSDEITDPDADEFFTVIDGQPVTFGEFNEMMEQDFETQKLTGDRYE